MQREPVRGTQSFVHTLSACRRRPSLTVLEVLWRWGYGVPALWAVWRLGAPVVLGAPVDWAGLKRMSLLDPMAAATTAGVALDALVPPVWRVARWLGPLLAAVWIVVSSLGRTVVLRRADRRLHARPGTLMGLQTVRMVALGGSFWVWFRCLEGGAGVTIGGPVSLGQEPNLVGYCAIAIVATLGLFVAWAVGSWALSVAPLLAMLHDLGVAQSLRAAFRLGPVRGKLVEINLVMGIVKIALIVLAMVFSATPLPFESVATGAFLGWWWVGVTVLYLVASDFFHVARLVAYLELWRTYDGDGDAVARLRRRRRCMMGEYEDILTERLTLIAMTRAMLASERAGDGLLGTMLGCSMPANWPPEHWEPHVFDVLLAQFAAHPEQSGWHRYIVLRGEGGGRTLIGCTGAFWRESAPEECEVGYSVLPPFERRGLATEACGALIGYIARDERIRSVVAHTLPALRGSIRVMEKCGLVFEGEGEEAGTVRYRLWLRPTA